VVKPPSLNTLNTGKKSAPVVKIENLPAHVAIVPDGNGRWAKKHGLPRLEGHHAGAENMRRMVAYLNAYPVKYLTLYGFSTENWSRPDDEVSGLFRLLDRFINKYVKEIHREGIKLRHIGRMSELPEWLQRTINQAIELTKDNTRMTLNVAFNYGGRMEIVEATRRIVADGVPSNKVDEKLFNDYLYTAGLPDVDLVIRTADERRLSNFLIWQTAYSEYYFTSVLWPDFDKAELEKALLAYSQRRRRFGGL
jgi:undecaprenyl diphosphate synthase